jgi:cholesterol oxidase
MVATTALPDPIPVTTPDGCRLELRHHPGAGRPVLLVHGASAGSATFRIGERETLVDFLRRDFDVWTVDWRAGMLRALDIFCANRSAAFTIDAAAAHDVPAAIARMRELGVQGTIGVVGHCLGGGIVAQGIARGALPVDDVERVVVTGLALFYRAAVDNVLKAEDRALEELLARGQALLHPLNRWDARVCTEGPVRGAWDRLIQDPYEVWLDTPLPHDCRNDFCHRISYMFGMPYVPDNIPGIHADHLPQQFGDIPMQLLLHCCQNLRRGHAAPYVPDGSARRLSADTTYLNREPFRDRRLTLITGNVNSLWHRDSIDTMYEWLRRGRRAEQPRDLRKHVLDGYGHQDLYWGTRAPTDVFPLIAAGLAP